ncbi:DNA-binding protein, partial [Limosilactobacillus reuteri]|nr:DNA-binding protein [Limosilactobacillus reuteri]MDA9379155.1 DNA-binding protein [Limosilactobacillus reuteri]
MSMIDFTNTEMAVAVIFTLIIMFVISFAVSFLFWLIYHQNMKKVDYRMKLATQLVVNKKRH